MLNNWAHDSGKAALRFDGTYKSGTRNGVMAYNVAWNTSAFMVKGDNHTFLSNTGFDQSNIGASWAASSLPRAQTARSKLSNVSGCMVKVGSSPGKGPDAHTRFSANLLDGAGIKVGKGASSPREEVHGIWADDNVVGFWQKDPGAFNINQQLRDPWNRDFRACPGSLAAENHAGAYPVWTPNGTSHWIPGARRANAASQPSPRDGAAEVPIDADLIFLGARRAGAGHVVFFGTSADTLKPVGEALKAGENVAHVAGENGRLRASTTFFWRVDALLADGTTGTGAVWSFTTGSDLSCG